MRPIICSLILFAFQAAYCQNNLTTNPAQASFIYLDIDNFWQEFDQLENLAQPFTNYLDSGSAGLKDFIPNRIESAEKLTRVVKRRKPDYEAIRQASNSITQYQQQIIDAYTAFKKLYPTAVFPATYFVIGAFNTGGTATKNGLVIGVEKLENMDHIPYVVAHELIHFNQKLPVSKYSLLAQSIKEGSADFIGELISGKCATDAATFNYGNENEEALCKTFVQIMDGNNYKGWLYGSTGKKAAWPNDLGYWMGYKICEAYYLQADDKQTAIIEILIVKDYKAFLLKSGYLNNYFTP